MTKVLSGFIAGGLMSTMVLAAQEQAPGRGGAPQAPGGAAAQAAKTVTVSGCVQPNTPAASPGGAPAAGAAAAPKFMLSMKPTTAPGGAPAAGAVGTAGAAGSRYQLVGDDKTISPHLNHQVEITGTLQGAPASAGSAPTLKVESLKMISSTCS
jgi:hypothetical protein